MSNIPMLFQTGGRRPSPAHFHDLFAGKKAPHLLWAVATTRLPDGKLGRLRVEVNERFRRTQRRHRSYRESLLERSWR